MWWRTAFVMPWPRVGGQRRRLRGGSAAVSRLQGKARGVRRRNAGSGGQRGKKHAVNKLSAGDGKSGAAAEATAFPGPLAPEPLSNDATDAASTESPTTNHAAPAFSFPGPLSPEKLEAMQAGAAADDIIADGPPDDDEPQLTGADWRTALADDIPMDDEVARLIEQYEYEKWQSDGIADIPEPLPESPLSEEDARNARARRLLESNPFQELPDDWSEPRATRDRKAATATTNGGGREEEDGPRAPRYDGVAAVLGAGAPSKWLLGARIGPYLQNAHVVVLAVALLGAFVHYPGNPLTMLSDEKRVILQQVLAATLALNAVFAVLSARAAKLRQQPPLLWALKALLLGGLAYEELRQNAPLHDER